MSSSSKAQTGKKDNFRWLTCCPASDCGFKSALEDALLEELDEALEYHGRKQGKTAFKAIRAEIKRRLEESGCDPSELPKIEDYAMGGRLGPDSRDQEIRYHRSLLERGHPYASKAIAECRLSTEPEISTPSMKNPILRNIPPSQLELHPVLDGFPELPPSQFEPLKASRTSSRSTWARSISTRTIF